MRVVVDTNIVFSAILDTDSKIAQIILQPRTRLNFYSTEQLLFEIDEHKQKLQKFTNYSDDELTKIIRLLTNKIRFINVALIPINIYKKAEKLTNNIDEDDCEFVALTMHVRGKFWSGDNTLRKGLVSKNWNKFVTTPELYDLIRKRI